MLKREGLLKNLLPKVNERTVDEFTTCHQSDDEI